MQAGSGDPVARPNTMNAAIRFRGSPRRFDTTEQNSMYFDHAALKHLLGNGLLSFPVTDFTANGDFNEQTYRQRLEWLMPYGASVLFAAGGTGEFFSLEVDEYAKVVKTATDTCKKDTPIVAGVGQGTRAAIRYAQAAEANGASGILLMPHYLTEASLDGIVDHVEAVCKSTKLGVVVYNRANSQLNADALERLVDRCPNLIGFKDGVGNIELMMSVHNRIGDRLVYVGGLPTAEIFAPAYLAMGVNTYSSAVFNFVPATAVRFYEAIRANDHATVNDLLKRFYFPLIALRNRKSGYAVSMIKAGATLVGHSAGPVRSPLTELTEAEVEILAGLIKGVEPEALAR